MKIVNPKDIDQLINSDVLFADIYDKFGPPPNWQRPRGFFSLVKIILEQQISLASANAHFNKLKGFLHELTPSEILNLSDTELRTCHISRQKSRYLKALSQAMLNGELDLKELNNLPEQEVRNQLIKIKGIGNWTADIYLMFCLQAKDIFPIGDIAVVTTVKELTDVQTKEDIINLAENWKPLRSLASYFLWYYYLKKRNRL